MTHREPSKGAVDTIIGLLDVLEDVREASKASNPGRGDAHGSRCLVLDDLYHAGTFRELEAMLRACCVRGRRGEAWEGEPLALVYQNVRWWWLDAPRVRRDVPKRTVKGGVLKDSDGRLVTEPRLVRVRHRYAVEEQAVRGARWIAAHWAPLPEMRAEDRARFRRFPSLPKEMLLDRPAA